MERPHPGALGEADTSDQLDVIAGRREQLSGHIQEAYGLDEG